MVSNKDIRIEGSNLIINGKKHPLDPAVNALIKRANTVQGKLSALDTKITAIEALEKTASGNPISLTGVAEAYAIALGMSIEPIQSGSGDPSPTNVRPISGLTSGEIQTTNGTDTNTATITFGQTVYGGSVNFKTGEVIVTHAFESGTITTLVTRTYNAKYQQGGEGRNKNLCDKMPYEYHLGANPHFFFENNRLITRGLDGSTEIQLCYELATPTTLTLTPAELELLKGNNTISGNGVTINISYIGR